MRRRVGFERDSLALPSDDIPPRQVREPTTAVRDVPAIEAASVIGDDETGGVESHLPKDGERVLAQPTIRVIERDEDLTWRCTTLATHGRGEFGKRYAAPSRSRKRLHLRGEPAW